MQTKAFGYQTRERTSAVLNKMAESKEGSIITWVAAGVAKVMPSVTADLWPQVGEGVSEQSVVSEFLSCSSTRMAVEDSLSHWEECSLGEEPVAWLCIKLLGAGEGGLYKQAERSWTEVRQEGPRSSGGGGGLEPLPGERVGWWKATTDGHEEEASGVLCLCVCEAFTSNTLAVRCWLSSWVWGKRIMRREISHSVNTSICFTPRHRRQPIGFMCTRSKEIHPDGLDVRHAGWERHRSRKNMNPVHSEQRPLFL